MGLAQLFVRLEVWQLVSSIIRWSLVLRPCGYGKLGGSLNFKKHFLTNRAHELLKSAICDFVAKTHNLTNCAHDLLNCAFLKLLGKTHNLTNYAHDLLKSAICDLVAKKHFLTNPAQKLL